MAADERRTVLGTTEEIMAAITDEKLALKWSEDILPIMRPIRRMRLTDSASIQSQAWSSVTWPQTDYTLAVVLTVLHHATEHDALSRLIEVTEEALAALRQILTSEKNG